MRAGVSLDSAARPPTHLPTTHYATPARPPARPPARTATTTTEDAPINTILYVEVLEGQVMLNAMWHWYVCHAVQSVQAQSPNQRKRLVLHRIGWTPRPTPPLHHRVPSPTHKQLH